MKICDRMGVPGSSLEYKLLLLAAGLTVATIAVANRISNSISNSESDSHSNKKIVWGPPGSPPAAIVPTTIKGETVHTSFCNSCNLSSIDLQLRLVSFFWIWSRPLRVIPLRVSAKEAFERVGKPGAPGDLPPFRNCLVGVGKLLL